MKEMKALKEKVLAGGQLTMEEARSLITVPLALLSQGAEEIRAHFCEDKFDLCTIINGKSGRCTEDCKFCAQSAHHQTRVEEYPLLPTAALVEGAKENQRKGVLRYSIVTSGKRISSKEVEALAESIRAIKKETDISICASLGLLTEKEYRLLKEAGLSRIHNNLETSERNFPNVCTTHTFAEKIRSIEAALSAGLSVCSGGIMGLSETMEDRIQMAFTLRDLGVDSIPINILNPIPGTPYEKNPVLSMEEVQRIVGIFRFILPSSVIRLAGGRGLLADKGRSCFAGGANGAISGDMLTTAGISVKTDLALIKELGFKAVRIHG
ncbi:MAG: biotin synthase BioB [Anaerovoracaceae bacterium]